MKIDIINDILELKENRRCNILKLGLSTNKEKENLKLDYQGDSDFDEIYFEYLSELTNLAIYMLTLLKEDDIKTLETKEEIMLLAIDIIGKGKENEIQIRKLYELDNKDLDIKLDELRVVLTNKLRDILEDYLKNEDDIRQFDFIFVEGGKHGYTYQSFCRLCDRPIPQQKDEIRLLLNSNIEDILFNEIKKTKFDLSEKHEKIFVSFKVNMNNISKILELKIGTFKK